MGPSIIHYRRKKLYIYIHTYCSMPIEIGALKNNNNYIGAQDGWRMIIGKKNNCKPPTEVTSLLLK